jgi:hypothetical protein
MVGWASSGTRPFLLLAQEGAQPSSDEPVDEGQNAEFDLFLSDAELAIAQPIQNRPPHPGAPMPTEISWAPALPIWLSRHAQTLT